MSKGQRLRALVNERLTAAAEDIFALFERTIAEYEEELCRSKEENERKQQLLDSVLRPQVLVHRAGLASDHVTPTTQEEEAGPSLKQENTDCPRIKEEPGLCIQWEQDFPLIPNLDYTEPEPEPGPGISLDPQRYLQSHDEQTDHTFEAESTQNWEPPIDEDIEADGEDYNQQNELDSINNSTERRKMVKNKNAGPEKSNPSVKKKSRGRKPRNCSICEKKFASSQDLRRHMCVHTGEKPFSCPVCEKRFTRKYALQSHLAIHTGERLVSCPVCKKDFARKTSLTLHMAMHTKVKPFSCPVCKRGFTQKGNLKLHMTQHTGDKPFGCTECDARFPLKKTLERHKIVHTGERPFRCPYCDRTFTRNEKLRLHINTQHFTPKDTGSNSQETNND